MVTYRAMRKSSPLVKDSDRMAAAALTVDRLREWMYLRTLRRAQVLDPEPYWDHSTDSGAGIHSEAAELFPGPRSAWVR